MSRRRTAGVFVVASGLLASAAVWGLLMVRADAKRDGIDDQASRGPLTAEQYAAAVRIVQREVKRQKASLTSATAILVRGKVRDATVGPACTSGHLIRIRLLGRFPHITVSPPPGAPGGPVRLVGITVDAATGRACLLGVGTGTGHPYGNAADLMPALDD
jgi:hypothetical protein